jgi:hypothetical protein
VPLDRQRSTLPSKKRTKQILVPGGGVNLRVIRDFSDRSSSQATLQISPSLEVKEAAEAPAGSRGILRDPYLFRRLASCAERSANWCSCLPLSITHNRAYYR